MERVFTKKGELFEEMTLKKIMVVITTLLINKALAKVGFIFSGELRMLDRFSYGKLLFQLDVERNLYAGNGFLNQCCWDCFAGTIEKQQINVIPK